MDEKRSNVAETIGDAKKYTAHTYLSTKIDLANLHKTFGDKVSVNHFVRKAI
jgi:hypothetical protein